MYSWRECLQWGIPSAPDTPSQPEDLQYHTHLYFSTTQYQGAQFQNRMLHKEQPLTKWI